MTFCGETTIMKYIIAIVILCVTGCTAPSDDAGMTSEQVERFKKFEQVNVDMSRQQVTALLGPPYTKTESQTYHQVGAGKGCDYIIEINFEGDIVSSTRILHRSLAKDD